MTLLDRHIEFVEALRAAGLPVSLAEGLDAVRAIDVLDIDRRETLRSAYAATLVKRQNHRPGFDQVFDLYFPLLIGDGHESSDADSRYSLTIGRSTSDDRGARNVRDYPSIGRTARRRCPTSATPWRSRWRWAIPTCWRCSRAKASSGSG